MAAVLSAAVRASYSTLTRARWLITSSVLWQQSGAQVAVSEDRRKLTLQCEGEQERRFHGIWLRHNCRCPVCTSAHNNQTVVEFKNLVRDIKVESASISGDQLNVEWSVSGRTVHNGSFDLDWLRDHDYSNTEQDHNNKPLVAKELPVLSYNDIMASDEGLYQWLLQLNHYGVCLLKNVPARKSEITKVVKRIGDYAAQSTIFGQTFDVVISNEPTNIAYTSSELLLHMDQGYYESTPGIQLLHCIKFDECVTGGESILLDAYPVVEEFRRTHPKHFDTLTRIPVRLFISHYTDDKSVDYFYEKKIINLNRDGEIVGINWHPQFFTVHLPNETELEEFYDAYILLGNMFDNSQMKLFHRLQPGEAITFNNRRILHSRYEFKLNGGQRKLEGTYAYLDDFRSRFLTLRKMLGHTSDRPCMILNSSTSQ